MGIMLKRESVDWATVNAQLITILLAMAFIEH